MVSSLEEDIQNGKLDANNVTLVLVAASILYSEGCYESALRVLHGSDDLEAYAMRSKVSPHFIPSNLLYCNVV